MGESSSFVLGYVYCLSCCFHEFSHQPSLTSFICLLVCERMAGAPFIPRCSMVLDVDLDAYRRESNADAELGAFTFLKHIFFMLRMLAVIFPCIIIVYL